MRGGTDGTGSRGTSRRPSRKLVATVAVLLVLGGAGTVLALSYTDLGTQYISLFSSSTAASHFNIESYSTSVQALGLLVVTVGLKNTDTAAHNATVYVALQNSTAVTLINGTQATGVISGGGSITLTYSFSQANLAVDYDSTFISVHDVS